CAASGCRNAAGSHVLRNGRVSRNQIDIPATEADRAIHLGVEAVVIGACNQVAGLETGAALLHDDRASRCELPTVDLDAAKLRVRVATVSGRALSLFMCHDNVSTLRSAMTASAATG